MKLFLFTLLVTMVTASPIKKTENLRLQKGQEISIESPGYPEVPRPGTRITWYITSDPDTNVQLTCEDLRITPSENCEKGYFMVNNGENEEKYCGSESGLTEYSVSNNMILEFDVNWSSGMAKCLIKSIEHDNSTIGEELVKLMLGKPAYNRLYFDFRLTRKFNKIWNFETTPGHKIGLHCTNMELGENCNDGKLVIHDGNKRNEFCTMTYAYEYVSTSNIMKLELKTGKIWNGRLNCLVQSVDGDKPFQYKNAKSAEVDSIEFTNGSREKPGRKQTDCNCGRSFKSAARIINGEEVAEGKYPWVVWLNYDGYLICGGSIITQSHILTAAHCIHKSDSKLLKVYIGATVRSQTENAQIIQVKEIIEHQQYDVMKYYLNDVAILLLEEKIKFTDRIGPICLTPNKQPLDNKYITVIGWGKDADNKYSNKLMRAHMRVVDYNTCSYMFYRQLDTSVTDRICTWAASRDSCNGDSGGPLVWLDPEINRYTQIALVSFGKECNSPDPNVNTNVAHFYDWIQSTIQITDPSVKSCKKI